jgi:hypothetical protein
MGSRWTPRSGKLTGPLRRTFRWAPVTLMPIFLFQFLACPLLVLFDYMERTCTSLTIPTAVLWMEVDGVVPRAVANQVSKLQSGLVSSLKP